MDRTMRPFRVVRALPVLAALAGLLACDNLLDVEQPGLITEEDLNRGLMNALVASAEGEYHVAFNWVANSGAAATDEAIFAHGWSPWEDYDERDLSAVGCPHDNCGLGYDWMQRARATGVRSVAQLKGLQAPDSLLARTLNYAGYSTLLLADYLCEVPLNGASPVSVAVAYDSAIALFTAAVQAAGTDAYLKNLANVGIARAYLNQNNLAQAITYAKLVDPAFQAWVRFVNSTSFGDWVDKYNLYYRTSGFISPSEFSLALDPALWATKRDKRVPFDTTGTHPMFTSKPEPRAGYIPFVPYSFEGWGVDDTIPGGADIRFASGLEARHIIAEAGVYGGAGAWTTGEIVAFIDERRAVGGFAAYAGATTTDALATELREQRKMDFYFAGYRMPDIIRYKKYHTIDMWPTGPIGGYPPGTPYLYGTVECWPVGASDAANP